ncbi:hypothetical protein FNV43_RR01956 [Rhamnella rubrinervis]|uniref:Uncharacterized protein n=1 Tax=Rhamnella rubrinervis TaxID=2594499 RepID=A0A8K0HRY9_9ROSA|nr:hypothetical protein FNV43_RR01956 [Rhamnella rubrinervis]
MMLLKQLINIEDQTTKFVGVAEEDAGIDPNGEKAEKGPGATKSSGFGGLRLEGMLGIEDPIGVGNTPPGEGKSGEMSGDSSWKVDGGGFEEGNAGEAEILEALGLT